MKKQYGQYLNFGRIEFIIPKGQEDIIQKK